MKLARIYLGVLLALMALGQLASFGDFADIVEEYDVAGSPGTALAILLIALELAAAGGLLAPVSPPLRRLATQLGLAAALLWSLLALQGLARGLELESCGCFGRYLGQPLTLWVVPQDALFVALAGVVARGAARRAAMPRGTS